MASALTVLLLGCWLAGRKGVRGGREFPKPTVWVSPSRVVALGGSVTIRCESQYRGLEFFLRKAGDSNPRVKLVPDGTMAEFPIPRVDWGDGRNYTCEYHSMTEENRWSHLSDPVEIVVRDAGSIPEGETDPTQPGAAPAPTRPGGSEPSGLTIIAGVSTAAAVLLLLLLLLVAFVCFRRTRARKGAAPRPSSSCSVGVLKAPAQQDPVYASVDEGKELQTLEPDPEGLTYAELDGRALQAKRGGPAPTPEFPQPSVYAAINMSRGAPQ